MILHFGVVRCVLLAGLLFPGTSVFASEFPAPPADVQAVLDNNCVKCHGPLELLTPE
jgi:hypothetical protein